MIENKESVTAKICSFTGAKPERHSVCLHEADGLPAFENVHFVKAERGKLL